MNNMYYFLLTNLGRQQKVATAHQPEEDQVIEEDLGHNWSVDFRAEIDQSASQDRRREDGPCNLGSGCSSTKTLGVRISKSNT